MTLIIAQPRLDTASAGSYGSLTARAELRPSTLRWPPTEAGPTEAIAPICGMTVDIASARYHSQAEGRTTYFCCLHCKETFEQDPRRYLSTSA